MSDYLVNNNASIQTGTTVHQNAYKTSPFRMSHKLSKLSKLFAKSPVLCQLLPVEMGLLIHILLAGDVAEFGHNTYFQLPTALTSESLHLPDLLTAPAHTAEQLCHCRHVPDSLLCFLWFLDTASLAAVNGMFISQFPFCSVLVLSLPVNPSQQGPVVPCASACLSHNEETGCWTVLLSTGLQH